MHLRSVMRSVEGFSREEDLMTASVAPPTTPTPSSSAFQKREPESLFIQGSEGKLITGAQTPERGSEVLDKTGRHELRPSLEAETVQRMQKTPKTTCDKSSLG